MCRKVAKTVVRTLFELTLSFLVSANLVLLYKRQIQPHNVYMHIDDTRTAGIINVLLDANDYVSSVVIAEKTGISESTLFRLLPNAEKCVAPYDLSFSKRRGKGFMLIGGAKEKKRFIADFVRQNYTQEFSAAEKSFLVLLYLLNEKDSIKLASLGKRFKISQSSVSKILSDLEPSLAQSGCTLVRKRGVGTCIAGNEEAARYAALNTACLYVNFNEFMSLLYTHIYKSAAAQNKLKLYSFTCAVFDYLKETADIALIFDFVEKIEKLCAVSFSDMDFVLLFLCVCIMEIRCINHFFMPVQSELAAKNAKLKASVNEQSAIKKSALTGIQKACRELPFLQIEENFRKNETYFFLDVLQNTEALSAWSANQKYCEQIADNFVSFVEASLNGHVEEYKKVVYIVYMQILQLIKKHRSLFAFEHAGGSFAENILNKNGSLRQFSTRAAEYLNARLHIKISENECAVLLSFIAPFFVYTVKKISAVLICASGVVISSILRERIGKLFPELDPIETVSVRKLTDRYVKEKKIDFVISFIETANVHVPVAYISANMDDADMLKIKRVIQTIQQSKKDVCNA